MGLRRSWKEHWWAGNGSGTWTPLAPELRMGWDGANTQGPCPRAKPDCGRRKLLTGARGGILHFSLGQQTTGPPTR